MSTAKKPVVFIASGNVICCLHLKAVLGGRGALLAALRPQHTQRALGGGRGENGAGGCQKAVAALPKLGTEEMNNSAHREGRLPTQHAWKLMF